MKSSAKKSDRLTWSQKATRLRMRLRDPEWRARGRRCCSASCSACAGAVRHDHRAEARRRGPQDVRHDGVCRRHGRQSPRCESRGLKGGGQQGGRHEGRRRQGADAKASDAKPAETPAPAPDPYDAVKARDIVNPVNTVWTLVAAFLVFGMQVGFTMLEAGFCRSRETVNVLMECIVDTCLCGILFYAFGYAFMFSHGNGFIGHDAAGSSCKNAPATYEGTGVAFLAHWIFQFAFADTCSTITSGAMIGRTGFVGDLLYSVGVSGFIYPIIGHWAWGPDGFLATMGTPDRTELGVLADFRDELPRLRRLDGRAYDRRLDRAGGLDRAGSPFGSKVQARWRRPDAATRPDDCRLRRFDPVVRLVRIQSRQHALGDGF